MVLFERTDPQSDGMQFKSNALSGGERNRLFMRADGNFKELTLVSGADFREDGRGFVLFDYNNDGWVDVGVTSPNEPRFRILKNRFADLTGKNKSSSISIQLVGGHQSKEPTTEWSPRDPFGATLLVTIGDQKRLFLYSGGEGLSSQNSNWMHIGLGENEKIDRVEIQWPSGKKSVKENLEANSKVRVFENPDEG